MPFNKKIKLNQTNGNSTLLKSLKQEPHHHMQFTLGFFPFCVGYSQDILPPCDIRFEYLSIIFTQPLSSGRIGQFFKRSLTGLNSEFSLSYTSCLTKAEEPSLPYYLPIAGGRIIGFIPFPYYVQDLNSCRRVQFLR